MPKTSSRQARHVRYLIGTALIGTSLSPLALPLLAQVPGGTIISNTATATYQEPGGATIATESNTVQVTVAEVAGVSLAPSSVSNLTTPGGLIQPGNTIAFDFILTNIGNDPSKFVLPTPDTLNSNAAAITNGDAKKVTYVIINPDGSTTTPPNNDIGVYAIASTPPGGSTPPNAQTISLDPGQRIRITVEVLVDAAATGNVVVNLGNTSPIGQDNLPRIANTDDVYTLDNADGTGQGADGTGAIEVDGVPINGTREASATKSVPINAKIIQPFVEILKTSSYAGGTPSPDLTDDVISYSLGVKVAGVLGDIPASLQSLYDVDDLNPTYVNGISSGGGTPLHVLVSDVLPTGTNIKTDGVGNATGIVSPASAWTLVVSTTDPNTFTGTKAIWTTTIPITESGWAAVKQIGWIYTANTALPKGTGLSVAPTPLTFGFGVKLGATYSPGDSVRNIALVHGEKDGVTPTSSTTPSVFDESGDTDFNNDSNVDGSSDTPSDPKGSVSNGDDTGNNNTGSGGSGENNVVNIPLPPGALTGILNGTVIAGVLHPDAIGTTTLNTDPNYQNDDFTNKVSAIKPLGQANSVPSVSFANSLRLAQDANGNSVNNETLNIKLTIDPADLADLPPGITTIIFERADGVQAIYSVNKSSPSGSSSGISITPPASLMTIPVIENGADVQYAVKIDLPDNAPRIDGFDVPVIAFIDKDNDNTLDSTEPRNITIDRVYTGFVKLVKTSQILSSTGTAIGALDQSPKSILEGQIIKYVLSYQNISEAQPASGQFNVTIDATNMVITEDGASSGNNWALDLDGDSVMDTRATNTPAAPADTLSGAIATTGTNPFITKYTDTVPTVVPQATGTFTFHREFNQTTVSP